MFPPFSCVNGWKAKHSHMGLFCFFTWLGTSCAPRTPIILSANNAKYQYMMPDQLKPCCGLLLFYVTCSTQVSACVRRLATCLCVRLDVSVLFFFCHPLSVSLSGHLCVFPLHGKVPASLPLTILFAAKWLLPVDILHSIDTTPPSVWVLCSPCWVDVFEWRMLEVENMCKCQREWQHC